MMAEKVFSVTFLAIMAWFAFQKAGIPAPHTGSEPIRGLGMSAEPAGSD
jgi:hypothetical protein